MYTKDVYYRKPVASLRMSDAEIDELVKQVRAAEETAVETMRHEADLAKYEQEWREMYEAEIER